MSKRIDVGDTLPDFALPSDTGETVRRDDLIGDGPIVLYFYPKDDTPGCTAQACGFRDAYEDFTAAGARVVGVSHDGVSRHEAFRDKHRLPFTLLADERGELRRALGVPKSLGVIPGRVTYIIDAMGVVRHIYSSQIAATKHVVEALDQVRALSRATKGP